MINEISDIALQEFGVLGIKGFKPAADAFDEIWHALDTLGFKRSNTKGGAVVCRDDINFIRNGEEQKAAGSYREKNVIDMLVREYGSFMPLGGLGGFFTAGAEGMNANAHHAPQDRERHFQNYLLIAGTHIGYSKERGFGYNLRNFQVEPVTNCGFLVGVTNAWKEGKDLNPTGVEAAYGVSRLLPYKEAIIRSSNPIAETTRATQRMIGEDVDRAIASARPHARQIYLVEMLTINTDRHQPDYVGIIRKGLV